MLSPMLPCQNYVMWLSFRLRKHRGRFPVFDNLFCSWWIKRNLYGCLRNSITQGPKGRIGFKDKASLGVLGGKKGAMCLLRATCFHAWRLYWSLFGNKASSKEMLCAICLKRQNSIGLNKGENLHLLYKPLYLLGTKIFLSFLSKKNERYQTFYKV